MSAYLISRTVEKGSIPVGPFSKDQLGSWLQAPLTLLRFWKTLLGPGLEPEPSGFAHQCSYIFERTQENCTQNYRVSVPALRTASNSTFRLVCALPIVSLLRNDVPYMVSLQTSYLMWRKYQRDIVIWCFFVYRKKSSWSVACFIWVKV